MLPVLMRQRARATAAEAALRRRERQLSHALSGSGVGFWEWDPESAVLHVCDGKDHVAEGTCVNALERMVPGDRERVLKAFAAHVAAPQAQVDLRCRFRLDTGGETCLRLQGRALAAPGEPLHLTGLWSDVSLQTAHDLERRRLSSAIENSTLAVLSCNAAGLIEAANRRVEALTGRDPADLPGRPLSLVWSDETPAATQAALAVALQEGLAWEGDVICRALDGRRLWHRVTLTPVRDAEGGLTGFVSVHEDITERHRLQERLSFHVSTVNAVLEASPSGILVADLEGRPRLTNQRLRQMWSLSPMEVRDETPWALFATLSIRVAEPRESLETLRALTASPGEVEAGVDLVLADGRIFERASMAVAGEDGATWGRVWFFTDVSGQKRIERALSDQLEFQQTLLNTLPNPVFYTNQEGQLLGCNRAFADFLKEPPDLVLGEPLCDALADQSQAALLVAPGSSPLERGGRHFFDMALTDKQGGTRTLAVAKAIFSDTVGQVSGVVAVMTDITDLKQTAEELRRSNQELEQFAYVASHDLQEPLRTVSSYLGLLRRRYGGRLDEDAQQFIRYAIEGAHRMQALIQDLLQFSRLDTRGVPFERVDVAACVNHAVENLRGSLEETQARLRIGDLPWVQADAVQMTSLFQNLIGNALKYRAPSRTPEVEVGVERRGEVWEFFVRDNGIGIDPRFAEKVFMIFQRLHSREAIDGTGIGLALAKKIVERHGGRIWLEGAEDQGTTFRFTLPVAPGAQTLPAREGNP
ncbi:PAS domain S-box protein [Pararhodospirillum photometricum]|uniref:histidine kinase n=1 Tax=Pararhodospirillum photometricum DSM 122 TaxID=1150469 RepID=H6SNS3_PARPM|nr:PAS domain S-box protein [Pararhodospirillum photometricum]CCG09404.1 Sensor protein [Pararhodospirillum photometricum DSM 122]